MPRVPWSLGAAFTRDLAEYHRHLQANEPVPAGRVQETFLNAWQANEDRQPIQFKDGETGRLLAQGVALLELYMQEPPPQNIVAIEQAMMVPLFTSSGECLEKPLMAVLDLLNRDDHGLVVTEFKTAARRYSGNPETEMKLQATAYSHAIQQHYDEKPGIRYVILVKTKKPQVQIRRNRAE